MNKIKVHIIQPKSNNMILCIGSEESIDKLKNYKHNNKVSNFINFLIENKIYCTISCESGDETTVVSTEDLNRLIDNDLFVSLELGFEAIALDNKKKTYDTLEYVMEITGYTKEEIDDIFENSWWLDKFDF